MSLDPSRKADRLKMAQELVSLVESLGFKAKAKPSPLDNRSVTVRIVANHAIVGVDIGKLEATNGFIVPWNIESHPNSKEVTFSPEFGAATFASVNPFHRRKCMGIYPTWENTLFFINKSLNCIKDNLAFEGISNGN